MPEKIKTYDALHLRAEGDYAILEIETEKGWVELIRERLDSPFSHIVESLGIESRIKDAPAPPAAVPVSNEGLIKALEQMRNFDEGKYSKKYLGCLIADCIAALDDYYKVENIQPPQNPAGPVWVKGEYRRLYAQVKGGKRSVCYVDYDWHDGAVIHRDIATIKPEQMEISVRGTCYASMWFDKTIPEIDRFVKMCEHCNVEWLDESAPQVFTREQVFEIALAMGRHFPNIPTIPEMMEYMNTNFPPPINK